MPDATIPDYLTRVYTPGADLIAHLVVASTDPTALCGVESDLFAGGWFGTGSQDEYEHAAAVDLCPSCRHEVAS